MKRPDFNINLRFGAALIAGSVLAGLPLLWLLFSNFGTKFIFVLVPAAILVALAYKLHLDRLSQKTEEISEASRIHLATVEALATAIDARDQVDDGHVRRTQIYALAIGRSLALPESDIEALRTGALLHDIGKLAIPDHILSKPEKLTQAELEKTKIHPSIGASILEKIDFPYDVVPTVRHHQEAWDGTGYPNGLSGESIPLTARIVAVADAFDTIRGARPYRPARTRDEARKIIQSEAGKRFDPRIVNTLIRNLTAYEDEINAAGLGYADSSKQVLQKHASFVDQIKLANREVSSLYELAREFSSSVGLSETLSLFTRKLGGLVPFDTCAVYLLEGTKNYATAHHVEGENADKLLLRRLRVNQGATGFTLKTGELVQNADPDLDFSYSQVELTQQYSTMTAVPLVADDVVIGAVSLYSHSIESYSEENIRLLETLSRIASDAIEKSLKHDEVTTHALTDPMTGLPNARSLQMQFDKEVGRASRSKSTFQILMMDLDGFKAVNDSFGHKVGDDLLREVGKTIREQLRDYDFLARYGGDEFVALIPETSAADVADLCDRIETAVLGFALPVSHDKHAQVGVSLGASSYPIHGETFDHLIVSADKVMYERKTRRKRIVKGNIAEADTKISTFNTSVENSASGSMIVELDESHVVASAAVN